MYKFHCKVIKLALHSQLIDVTTSKLILSFSNFKSSIFGLYECFAFTKAFQNTCKSTGKNWLEVLYYSEEI